MERHLFVLGDSISMHYGPFLETFVAGQFTCIRKGEKNAEPGDLNLGNDINGGDSTLVLEYLNARVARGFKPDLLLLNCGLHDIKTDPARGAKRVLIGQYEKNLREISRILQTSDIPVVWIRTTHVDETLHNRLIDAFWRYDHDVVLYNAVADAVFSGTPIIDLYGFTKALGGNPFCDHVHFTEEVRRLQAAFIAGHLLTQPQPCRTDSRRIRSVLRRKGVYRGTALDEARFWSRLRINKAASKPIS